MTPGVLRLVAVALSCCTLLGCSLTGKPYTLSRASQDGLVDWQGDTALTYTKRKGFRGAGVALKVTFPDGGTSCGTVDTPGTSGTLDVTGLILGYLDRRPVQLRDVPVQLPTSGVLQVSLIQARRKGGSWDSEGAKMVSNTVHIPYSSRKWKPGRPTGLKGPDCVHEASRRMPPDLGQLKGVRTGPLGDTAGAEEYARGIRLKKQGRLDEALTALLDARGRTINHVRVWSAIAWVLQERGDTEAAVAWFGWVCRLAPDTPEGKEAAKALQRLGKTVPEPTPKHVSD